MNTLYWLLVALMIVGAVVSYYIHFQEEGHFNPKTLLMHLAGIAIVWLGLTFLFKLWWLFLLIGISFGVYSYIQYQKQNTIHYK